MKLALVVSSLSLASSIALAQDQYEVGKFDPPPGSVRYGEAVAIDGEWAMVGALASDDVFVYRRTPTGWVQTQQLRGGQYSQFGGRAIDIDVEAKTAVVGATEWGWPNAAGRVQVFELRGDEWVWTAGLELPGAVASDKFGWTAEVSGNVIAVGAPGVATPHKTSGRIFIYERRGGTWERTAELQPDDPDVGQIGGWIDLQASTLVTSSFLWDEQNGYWDPLTAGALVLERDSQGRWTRTAYLPEPEPGGLYKDQYGYGLALSTDASLLVVGDPGMDDWPPPQGVAYVWEKDSEGAWQYVAKLRASDWAGQDEYFGSTIAIEGDRILIGDPEATGKGSGEGAGYIFERQVSGQWPSTETYRLLVSDNDQGPFAYPLAVSRGFVLMGNNPTGKPVYLFELQAGTGFCPATSNSIGKPGVLSAIGSPQVSEDALTLGVRDCPAQSWGSFFISRTPHSGVPLQDGLLCLGRPLARLGGPIALGTTGSAYYPIELGLPPLSHATLPGSTWNAQFWYADPDSPSGPGNLTNAVSITFE